MADATRRGRGVLWVATGISSAACAPPESTLALAPASTAGVAAFVPVSTEGEPEEPAVETLAPAPTARPPASALTAAVKLTAGALTGG